MEGTRSPIQKDRDLEILAELYFERCTLSEMRVKLQERTNETYVLSISQIRDDLKEIKTILQKNLEGNIEEIKNEKLNELN